MEVRACQTGDKRLRQEILDARNQPWQSAATGEQETAIKALRSRAWSSAMPISAATAGSNGSKIAGQLAARHREKNEPKREPRQQELGATVLIEAF